MNLSLITGSSFRNVMSVFRRCILFTVASTNAVQACPVENKHIELSVDGHTLTAEVAADFESHMCGLAFRHDLPADHGMLFAYAEDQIIGFWMKNTFIPLSIAFLDADGKIIEIHDMNPDDPSRQYISRVPSRYALEVNQGWFQRKNVVIGDRVELDLYAGPHIFRYQSVEK